MRVDRYSSDQQQGLAYPVQNNLNQRLQERSRKKFGSRFQWQAKIQQKGTNVSLNAHMQSEFHM